MQDNAEEMDGEEEDPGNESGGGSSGSTSGKDNDDRSNSSTNQNKIPPDNLYIWKCGYCNSWSATTSIISEHAKIVHSAKPKYVVYLRDRLKELCDDKVLEADGEIFSGTMGGDRPALRDTVVLPYAVKPESDEDHTLSENSSEVPAEATNGPAETVSVKPEPEDVSYEVYINPDAVKEEVDEKPKITPDDTVDANLHMTFAKPEPGTNDTLASGESLAKHIDTDGIKQEVD